MLNVPGVLGVLGVLYVCDQEMLSFSKRCSLLVALIGSYSLAVQWGSRTTGLSYIVPLDLGGGQDNALFHNISQI